MKEAIKKTIENNSEGIEYLEIWRTDLDKVADEILALFDVSQQRELLNRFFDWEDMRVNGKLNDREQNNKYIDEFLKST